MAASVTLRPLYYPKAIQEQQTQWQSNTGREGMQVFYGGVLWRTQGYRVWCDCQRAPAESVDPDGKPSVPWTDETRAAHCRGYAVFRCGPPGLRRRGKETRTGARSGAGSSVTGRKREAGCCGACAPADIESTAAPLRLAVATVSVREGLSD